MDCSTCGHENAQDASFCGGCGERLAVEFRCPACGRANTYEQAFCQGCGCPLAKSAEYESNADPVAKIPKHLADKALTSRSALEGELKQITVLFADLKGSMEIAEQIDPEEWDHLLEPFFEILTRGVHRFEGTVNQYTGDGIMASFGAPIAHENHAQRACYTALSLREPLRSYSEYLRRTKGLEFVSRIGIHSGEVIVRKIHANLRMEFTALGHTVGLAQRMESIAKPGSIYLSEATQRLVKEFFELRDLGRFDVKGSSHPLRVFELEGLGRLGSRLEVSRARGLSRFVGRAEEMAALEAALDRAHCGDGQVVGVVGEAGVGKSRLCLEFLERCRARGISVYEAHCPAHGKDVPFLPILELLRNIFGISDDDRSVEARAKVTRDLVALDPALPETLPVLFEFLDIGDPVKPASQLDSEARRRQLFALFHRIMQVRGERGLTSVTLIDDLHWIDAASDAFLEQIVEAFEGSRGLLLLNFRPEYRPAWTQRTHYQQLPLARLNHHALHKLVEDQLGGDSSVQGLAERIEHVTAGNPLFTEELIQSLVDGGQLEGRSGAYQLTIGLEHLEIPSSVQSILAARIDRLSDVEKHVLRAASVIGRVFGKSILTPVVELPEPELALALDRLKTGDFLYERALFPTTEYAFTHPFSHEVVYESQLQNQRAITHARVARAIEDVDTKRLEERAPLIAYHWDRAREPARAVGWHQRAALQTLLNDPAASLRHWQRVRELVDELPGDRETFSLGALASARILNLGWQLGSSEEEAARRFEDGKELAARADNSALLAELHGAYGSLRGIKLGFAKEYVDHARQAARFADQTDDIALQSSARMRLVHGYLLAGKHAQAGELAEDTLRRMPPEGSLGGSRVSSRPALVGAMGLAIAMTGRDGDKAHGCLDEAATLSAAHGWAELEIYIRGIETQWLVVLEDRDAISASAGHVAKLSKTLETSLARSWASLCRGRAQLANGNAEQAAESFEAVLHIAEHGRSSGYMLDSALAGLAGALLAQGQWEAGRRRAEEAVRFARDHGLALDLTPWLVWVRSLTACKDRAGADWALEETRQRIEATGARLYEPLWHECKAGLGRAFGDGDRYQVSLREAQRLYAAMGATEPTKRIARALKNFDNAVS